MTAKRQLLLPQFVRVMCALILREITTTNGGTKFGYLWVIATPVASIAFLSYIFSYGFKSPSLGISFPLFYATGALPFGMYSSMQKTINSSLYKNKKLLFYPSVGYIDVIASRYILTIITQVVVFCIIFFSIVAIVDMSLQLRIPTMFNALLGASVLALGIGTLNITLFRFIPIWRVIWKILTRPLYILSCIIFLYEGLPSAAQSILWYNPIVHIVSIMRTGVYSSEAFEHADGITMVYPYSVGFIALAFGLLFLKKNATAVTGR